MAKMVGLSRSIKIEWLNKTVDYILEGKTEKEIRDALNHHLAFEITSPIVLRKSREILMNIWVRGSNNSDEVRKLALEAYKQNRSSKMALHWCMILLAYPIFGDVCGLIGKLTTIQDTFTLAWLKEKLYEYWGERTTLMHSTDKIVQTMKFLGSIRNEKVGVYVVNRHQITDEDTLIIIVKTILALKNKAYYEVSELNHVPQMFPFEFNVNNEFIHKAANLHLTSFGGRAVISD